MDRTLLVELFFATRFFRNQLRATAISRQRHFSRRRNAFVTGGR